jgi:hypothetical protein
VAYPLHFFPFILDFDSRLCLQTRLQKLVNPIGCIPSLIPSIEQCRYNNHDHQRSNSFPNDSRLQQKLSSATVTAHFLSRPHIGSIVIILILLLILFAVQEFIYLLNQKFRLLQFQIFVIFNLLVNITSGETSRRTTVIVTILDPQIVDDIQSKLFCIDALDILQNTFITYPLITDVTISNLVTHIPVFGWETVIWYDGIDYEVQQQKSNHYI